jgi:hypothetical protein
MFHIVCVVWSLTKDMKVEWGLWVDEKGPWEKGRIIG